MWRPTVLVGVGGLSGWEALAWAVDEALATGGDLLIAHACRADSPLAARDGRVSPGLLELADPPLARAVAAARSRLGGDRVRLVLRAGEPGHVVLGAADEADLVVVGAPTGHAATVCRVVTRAPRPTVVVRPVTADRGRPFAGHVVVGVSDAPAARATCEFAFAYAAAHRVPLAAVHVADRQREDYWFDERTLATAFPVEPAGLHLLAIEVEPWMHKYPEVAVKRAVFTGRPLDGLLRAARGARLLVVGDHGRVVPQRLLGSVCHGAVARAKCPVAVVRAGHADVPDRRFR
jgi:nucleotide-binding universal stress UspA family protein